MELKSYAIVETFKSLDLDTQEKLIGILSLERYGVGEKTISYLDKRYQNFGEWIKMRIKMNMSMNEFLDLFQKYEKFKEICTGGYSYYSYPEGYSTWLFTEETTFHPYSWDKHKFIIDIDERKVTFTKENFFNYISQVPINKTIVALQNTNICHENIDQNKNCIRILNFLNT